MSSSDYEWKGFRRVKPTLPAWLVERRPYDECPRCERFQYRPLYDGRLEESYGKCKHCEFKDDSIDVEPDIYVHDANKAMGDLLLIIFALAALAGVIWGVLHLLGVL